MSGIQNELGPKGFQAIEAAFNDNPDIPSFLRQFSPTFPVGTATGGTAREFMQLSPVIRTYVPYLAFIDRTGVIRAQHTGGDPFFADESAMEKNIRAEIMKLLAEKPASVIKPVKNSAKKK